jgi:hypothetical protein
MMEGRGDRLGYFYMLYKLQDLLQYELRDWQERTYFGWRFTQ